MKTYASKASAVRQAKKDHGADYLALGKIVTEHGKFWFEFNMVIDVFSHCPKCGIHLENGYGCHGDIVNGEKVIHDDFEIVCLGCGAEFGAALPCFVVTEEAPKFEKPHLNKSAMSGACSLVWDIAGSMLAANPDVKRKEILLACVERGIAFYTARTQYQKYREACKNDMSNQA